MGVEIPHMAADFDTPFNDSNLRLGMVSRRTCKKIDKSSPWNWVGNIRLGSLPILLGLVGSSQGEDEEENLRAIEGHGTFFKGLFCYTCDLQK